MYSIRTANIDDFKGINAVSQYLGYKEISDDECRRSLETLLGSKSDIVYVAEIENEIVGWLHLFMASRLASPSFYEIGGLVVNPIHRSKGIGKALVDEVTRTNAGKVRVRCNEKRIETHLFYESIGFKSTKVQRVFESNNHKQ